MYHGTQGTDESGQVSTPRRGHDMRKGLGAVLVGMLVLAAGGVAWANDTDPKNVDDAYARLASEYDVTAGKTTVLIFSTPQPGVLSTTALALGRLWFYDADCVRKFDTPFKPTPNDVDLKLLSTLGGIPSQGAVLAGTSTDGLNPAGAFPAGTNVTMDALHVYLGTGHAWLQGSGRNNATENWTPYDNEAFIPALLDDGSFATTTFHFSCPIKDLGADMNLMDTSVGDDAEFFPTGTTAQTLSVLIYNTDERQLASVHGILCKCVTITRASTLFGGAASEFTHWQFYKTDTGAVGSGYDASEETVRVDYTAEGHIDSLDVFVSDRAYRNPD